jgi:hypothetical protein
VQVSPPARLAGWMARLLGAIWARTDDPFLLGDDEFCGGDQTGEGFRQDPVSVLGGVLVHEAARGVEWPARDISSAVVAPVVANSVR